MLEENINKSEFLKAIQKYADEEKKSLLTQIKSEKDSELKKAEQEGIKDAYKLVSEETKKFESDLLREFAIKEHQSRQAVFLKRNEYIDSIFEEVCKRLVKFTESPAYKEFLLKIVNKVIKEFSDNFKVYLKSSDLRFAEDIKKLAPKCEVLAADDIKIGGLRFLFSDDKIIIDETFESKLYNEKSEFIFKSGMKIY